MSNLSDRFKAALEALVTRIAGKYDYAIPYACKVISQNNDGTLELDPDSPSLPGLSNVPIRYGAPGVKATVTAGARCFVVFEDGDPSKPVVAAWDMASPLVMLTFAGGSQPVARVGDLAQGGGVGQPITILVAVPIPVATPSGPGSIVPGTPISGTVSFDLPTNPPAPLYSVIVSGATNVQS